MTVSSLRVDKSETRDLAERDRARIVSRYGEVTDWHMSDRTFFTAFVVIMAALTVLALVLR